MKYYLKDPPIDYNEQFIVKYWGNNGEFKVQKEFCVFFASKNRHKQAQKICMNKTGCKQIDIISCSYQ